MNILHLSRSMGQGGAEKVVIDICENTSNMFDKVIVLSTGGVNVDYLEELGIHHIVIPDLNSKRVSDILVTIKIIIKVVKEFDIDLIHSHHRMAAFYAQIVKVVSTNISLIYTAHNVFYDKRTLTKLSLRKTKIIAVGEGVANNLGGYFKINRETINIINNSVKPGTLSKYSRPKECVTEKKVISCIGRLSKQKGIEYFIKAISNVMKREQNLEIKVLIIGDGETRQELEKLVNELNLRGIIEFLGYRANVYEYIKYSDFIVTSSLWEGFPLTPIECFSVGKTIIATNISGNNEIVIDKFNGLLVGPKDISALADNIIKLCKDSELLEHLEKNAVSSYNDKYSYKDYIKKYIEVYKG